ncbi:Hypothetical protein CINCED_3A001507 [Cinara cedri]|uniref:Uncharacterized protein n=1 Tax=Cinara cedri TaxID=506608 RepID=A0A5E4NSS4_9HEMI|nr:Hypothetical protein CINCED_3A001507 [Cinara cedri]
MFFSRTDFTIITLTVFIMEMPPFVRNANFNSYPRKYAEELELTTLNAPRLVRSAKTWCAMKKQEVKEFKFESDTKDYTEYFKATALKLTSQGEKEALCLLKDELIDIGFIYDNGLSNYEAFIRNKSITPVTVKSFTGK